MKAGRLSRYLVHCRPCKPKIPSHLIVFLCIWAIPSLTLQTEKPFPSCPLLPALIFSFFLFSFLPHNDLLKTWHGNSREVLSRFALIDVCKAWFQYHSSCSSSAKHRKHFWHVLVCVLWHEETSNWFFLSVWPTFQCMFSFLLVLSFWVT